MQRKTPKNEVIAAMAAFLFMLALAPAVHADSNCTSAAACGDALDETTPGDNQAGDAGADRDPPDGKRT
jgi:hypothetical protein